MDELFQPSINDCEKRLLKLYENILTDQNPVCTKCKSNNTDLTSPVGAWVVGNKFYSHSKRILFVGKNARGNPGKSYHGFQVVFKVEALGAQNGKNRSRIGRRHCGGEQQGRNKANSSRFQGHSKKIPNGQPGQYGGEEHSDGR